MRPIFILWALTYALALLSTSSDLGEMVIEGISSTVRDTERSLAEGGLGIASHIAAIIIGVIPIALVWLIPATFLIKFILNFRSRNVVPDSESVRTHRLDARFQWRLLYSFIVGAIDATALFVLLEYGRVLLIMVAGGGLALLMDALAGAVPVLSLALSEVHMRKVNDRMFARYGSHELIDLSVAKPEDNHASESQGQQLQHAEIVNLLQIGAARTERGAAAWVWLDNAIGKVSDKTMFLAGAIESVLAIATIGIYPYVSSAIAKTVEQVALDGDASRVHRTASSSNGRYIPALEVLGIAFLLLVALFSRTA